MATEPHAPAELENPATGTSAIENEIPTYRAVSPLAVASLVLGLISALSFADWNWLYAAGLGVILGTIGLWKIRTQPDVLTGANFARAGVGLSMIFALSSVTFGYVQSYLISRGASQFVKDEVLQALNERYLDGALWLRTTPEERRGQTPEQVRKGFMESTANTDPTLFEMAAGKVVRLIRVLERHPEAKLVFVGIEESGLDGITPVAIALLKFEGLDADHTGVNPKDAQEHDDLEEYAGVFVKGTGEGSNQAWWVDDYVYPYKPQTYVPKEKPVDDGHGHSH